MANKLSLQDLSKITIGKLLTSGFLEILGSESQYTGEENPYFANWCGRP